MSSGRLLAALAALACLGAAADPAERLADPAKEVHARGLFQQVRCVVCQNESIDDSEADLAGDLRRAIRAQVAEGRDDAQIRAFLVDRYGEFILLKPPFSLGNALLWLTPFAIVLGGAGLLLTQAHRRPSPEPDLTAEEEERLRRIGSS